MLLWDLSLVSKEEPGCRLPLDAGGYPTVGSSARPFAPGTYTNGMTYQPNKPD